MFLHPSARIPHAVFHAELHALSELRRERQKCLIRSLESEVASKMAELALLGEEREVLQLRSDVLQGAVACREDHVSVVFVEIFLSFLFTLYIYFSFIHVSFIIHCYAVPAQHAGLKLTIWPCG
jgi:hypothetical protein